MTTSESSVDSATALETKARPWGFLVIEGIVLVIIGAILLWAAPSAKLQTYEILVMLLGLYWIVSGVLTLVHMFTDHTGWGWKLFMGLISIVAGFYVVTSPVIAGIALPKIFVLVLGLWGIMYGIVALVMAFKGGGWGVGILGVIGIIFGIMLVANWSSPGMGLAMLWAGAVWAFIGGFVLIFRGFKQRSA